MNGFERLRIKKKVAKIQKQRGLKSIFIYFSGQFLVLGLDQRASIHRDDRTGGVGASPRRQINTSSRNILRLADTTQGHITHNLLSKVAQRCRHHLGLERTRGNSVAGNVAVAQVARHHAGHLVQRSLGSRVGVGLLGRDVDAVHGTDVDD